MSMQPIKRGLAALVLMGLALPALAQTTVSDAWRCRPWPRPP